MDLVKNTTLHSSFIWKTPRFMLIKFRSSCPVSFASSKYLNSEQRIQSTVKDKTVKDDLFAGYFYFGNTLNSERPAHFWEKFQELPRKSVAFSVGKKDKNTPMFVRHKLINALFKCKFKMNLIELIICSFEK